MPTPLPSPAVCCDVQRDTTTVKLLLEAGAEVAQPFLLDIFPPRQDSLFATKVLLRAVLLLCCCCRQRPPSRCCLLLGHSCQRCSLNVEEGMPAVAAALWAAGQCCTPRTLPVLQHRAIACAGRCVEPTGTLLLPASLQGRRR